MTDPRHRPVPGRHRLVTVPRHLRREYALAIVGSVVVGLTALAPVMGAESPLPAPATAQAVEVGEAIVAPTPIPGPQIAAERRSPHPEGGGPRAGTSVTATANTDATTQATATASAVAPTTTPAATTTPATTTPRPAPSRAPWPPNCGGTT